MHELYKKYRPRKLSEIIGQEMAVSSIRKLTTSGKIPHSIMLTGPSGVGKTTIARILKGYLECSDHDFLERNCADFRGVDDIRDIRKIMDLQPLHGRTRIWLIDECHKLTNDAQNAFLKLLEDTPRHVYFILATTDPDKMIKTIKTRCSQIKLFSLDQRLIEKLLKDVIQKEGFVIKPSVVDEICELAEGSARKALVLLEQVAIFETEKEQSEALRMSSFSKDSALLLARAIMFGGNWTEIARILRSLEEQDAEGIRYSVMGYARACLIGPKDGKKPPSLKVAPKAYSVIDVFRSNFYDSKHAGLAAACWEVFNQQ